MTHDGNSGNTGDITTLSDQIQACVEACVQARLEALGARFVGRGEILTAEQIETLVEARLEARFEARFASFGRDIGRGADLDSSVSRSAGRTSDSKEILTAPDSSNSRDEGRCCNENTTLDSSNGRGGERSNHGTAFCGNGVVKSKKCIHGRRKNKCAMCGGKGICPHNREKFYCRECKGGGFCEHERRRSRCKECVRPIICVHMKEKRKCRECTKPPRLCSHQRRPNECTQCGGASICHHQRRRILCKICAADADVTMPNGLEEIEMQGADSNP